MKFKIGHYFDKVLCDIMPMDCCHILLGRPWQYDRYAIHDGRLNQYTLWVNGKKQILLGLIESPDEFNCIAVKICMDNGKQFEKEVQKNQVCFAIISRKPNFVNEGQVQENNANRVPDSGDQVTNGSIDQVPEEIAELLNEYKDIIADDLPDGLPPVRSISHCMDLIPGASLPNKAPYRLTPTENEELNRQVHGLLQKGLIRESLRNLKI